MFCGEMWGRFPRVMQRRMLSGTYECTLDNRFRLAIPARVREPFADGVAMSLWFDDCAILAPRLDWQGILDNTFGNMTVLDDTQRNLSRLLYMYTWDHESLDKQGRVVVPEKLRAFAGIESTVTVVGNRDYLELWNPERLEARLEQLHREGVSNLGKRIVERAYEAGHSA